MVGRRWRWLLLLAALGAASAQAPPELVSAAATLVAQGLPDPAGGEYRTMTIGGEVVNAWLRPADGNAPRTAIGWTGLVYAVEGVGEPADVVADADGVLVAERSGFGSYRRPASAGPPQQRSALAACLLLRAGQPGAAAKLWAAQTRVVRGTRYLSAARRYLDAGNDWMTNLRGRAVWANQQRLDGVALADARLVCRLRPLIDTEAARRRESQSWSSTTEPWSDLAQMSALGADLEARAQRPPRRPAAETLDTLPTADRRIAALIADLDEAACDVPLSASAEYWRTEPYLADLVAEGEPAVERLLACAEHDQRLSRGVVWGNSVAPVRLLALIAVEAILDEQFDAADGARAARAWWTAYGHVPVPERWYRILRDDADPDGCLGAAKHITATDQDGHLCGEPLRGLIGPSVGDLLARRLRQGAETFHGMALALALADWDAKAHLDDLRWACARFSTGSGASEDLVRLWVARHEAGDAQALDEYAQRIRDWPTDRPLSFYYFEPLWRFGDQPQLAGLGRDAFTSPNSPWRTPAVGPPDVPDPDSAVFEQPLLRIPELRALVREMLDDTRPAGRFTPRATLGVADRVMFGARPNEHAFVWLPEDGPNALHSTEPIVFRVCDVYARLLGSTWGFPRFELYTSEATRNGAVRRAAETLDRYGRYVEPSSAEDDRHGWHSALIHCPELDHPATAEDVAAGRALFTLADGRPTRAVPLSRVPRDAQWPIYRSCWPEHTGVVQQAEERLEQGVWRRYYGFVGQSGLGCAPAGDILFPERTTRWWTPLPDGLWVRLDPPEPSRPTTIGLHVYNPRGVPRTTPAVWLDDNAAGAAALRPGLRMTLSHADSRPRFSYATPKPAWPAGQTVSSARFIDDGGRLTLQPAASVDVGRIDLCRLFGELRPGAYRVVVTMADQPERPALTATFCLSDTVRTLPDVRQSVLK